MPNAFLKIQTSAQTEELRIRHICHDDLDFAVTVKRRVGHGSPIANGERRRLLQRVVRETRWPMKGALRIAGGDIQPGTLRFDDREGLFRCPCATRIRAVNCLHAPVISSRRQMIRRAERMPAIARLRDFAPAVRFIGKRADYRRAE